MQPNGSSQWKKGLYRSRDGMIAGVCKGAADYLDLPVVWFRIGVVALVFFSVIGWPVALVAYIVAAIVIKPEPVVPFENASEREFYDSYASSRHLAIDRLRRTYDALDRRIQRIETIVTSRDFHWDKRMKQ